LSSSYVTCPDVSWCLPPEILTLGCDEVHVWRAGLNVTPSQLHRLNQTLAVEKLIRTNRFIFDKDRNYYIVARGVLRCILGQYLSVEPSKVRFSYGLFGKPELAEEASGENISFNLSHTHGVALYAITRRGRRVGIDVELVRPNIDNEKIAQRFFSPREASAINALPAIMHQEAFFKC